MRGISTSETTRSKSSVFNAVQASTPSTAVLHAVPSRLQDPADEHPRSHRVFYDQQRLRRRGRGSIARRIARSRRGPRPTVQPDRRFEQIGGVEHGHDLPEPSTWPQRCSAPATTAAQPFEQHFLLAQHGVHPQGDPPLAVAGDEHGQQGAGGELSRYGSPRRSSKRTRATIRSSKRMVSRFSTIRI